MKKSIFVMIFIGILVLSLGIALLLSRSRTEKEQWEEYLEGQGYQCINDAKFDEPAYCSTLEVQQFANVPKDYEVRMSSSINLETMEGKEIKVLSTIDPFIQIDYQAVYNLEDDTMVAYYFLNEGTLGDVSQSYELTITLDFKKDDYLVRKEDRVAGTIEEERREAILESILSFANQARDIWFVHQNEVGI